MVIRQHGKPKVSRQTATPTVKPENQQATVPTKKAVGNEGRKVVKRYNTQDEE